MASSKGDGMTQYLPGMAYASGGGVTVSVDQVRIAVTWRCLPG